MCTQMSSMMGGEAGSQEDMFAKLESMRAVITEVNNQFKDPVCFIQLYLIHAQKLMWLDNRKRLLSSASVSLNSYHFTKQNDLCKNSHPMKLTPITLL
jgi:arsenite/tail-anchored protein-transporting ATPase